MSYVIEWRSIGNNTWPVNTAVTTPTAPIENNLYNGQVQGYSLPAGNYTYSMTTENNSNYYNPFELLDRSGTLIVTLTASTNPWSGQGPFTGSFSLPFQTTVHARMVDYYMYNTRCTLTLTHTPLTYVIRTALQASGAIAFSNLRTTLGPADSASVALSQYGAAIANIRLSQFYGNSRALARGFTYRIFRPGYFADDPAWFSSRTEQYMGTTTDTSNINVATGGVVPNDGSWETYSVEWFGYFYATVTGTYTFYTVSDDASYAWVGASALSGYTVANCLINNGGLHGATERSGTISLTAGTYYPIRCQFGENFSGDNYTFSFAAPGIARTYNMTGYVFYPTGASASFPAESARIIKTTAKLNTDGVYHIIVNGTSTPTYCLMDSKWNGGGWMMLMKATRGTTFQFSSAYWTAVNTLNPSNTTRADGDAKFDVMNYAMIKDVMALWPDVGYTGGSVPQTEAWSWLVNNYYSNGARATALTGFSNPRDSPGWSDPTTFPGFSTSIWSTQVPSKRHIFGGGSHLGSINNVARWGFVFNENALNDFSSSDAAGGIGMSVSWSSAAASYSAGDFYGCCQSTTGLNRSMRVELYGR